ncbi:MAG: amidohydrolase family protein [Ignavibacteriales bacterium]
MGKTLIKAGVLFTGEKDSQPAKGQYLVLNGNLIESVSDRQPEGSFESVLDYSAKAVLPGIIDAHTHLAFNGHESLFKLYLDPRDKLCFEAVDSVRRTLLSGVTTCRDVGGFNFLDVSLKRFIDQGVLVGPRMFVSGKMITATGGHCHVIATEANGPSEIRAAVREQIKNGADMVKLMATGGGATPGQHLEAIQLELDEIKAATEVAHSNFRRVGAHAHGAAGIKRLVQGGIDIIDHGSLLDEDGAKMMADNGVFLCITPGHESMFPNLDADWKRRMMPLRSRAPKTIEIAKKHGVKMCMGTDSGGNPYAPHGKIHVCLEEFVKTGMSAREAIVCVTSMAAECIGVQDRLGTIAPGKLADIAVFEGDPTRHIEDLARVAAVIKDGKLLGL